MTEQNNTLAIEIGRKASTAWNEASKYGDGGDAMATHALFIAYRTMTFNAQVNRGTKAEPEIEHVSFDLAEYDVDPHNNDGTVDTKLKAARTVAVAEQVFDLSDLDNASKQRISRASKMALYLARKYADDDDDTYFARVSTRSVHVQRAKGKSMTTCLVVPEGAIYAEPAEDADDEVKRRYKKMVDEPRTLNGKDKASLAELSKRANPPKATRAAGDNKDKGATLVASIDFVTAIVMQNANPEADESDVALSNEVRRKLFKLASEIANYFTLDPMEEDETNENEASEEAAAA